MFDSKLSLPVLLQCIDTDLSILGDIWMEDFGEEETLGRFAGEIFTENQFHFEDSS